MTSEAKRALLAAIYKSIIGRNYYSMNATKRECCFKKYSNGRYYSDCSSSIRLTYKKANIGLNNIGSNTVAMYQSKLGKKVDCKIKNGVPTDVSALRVGDILLFAGTDSNRAYADYVGHVEMVRKINKQGKVQLCGHGSGRPKLREMVNYCKYRQKNKTSKTKRGNTGLICVKRFIPD